MKAINIILQYVEGEIEATEFSNALYTNPKVQELLCDPSISWQGTFLTSAVMGYSYANVYDYLIELDYSRFGGKYDAVGALELFLQKKEVSYSKDDRYGELFRLMLDSMPGYIDMDINTDSDFFRNQISPIIAKEITKAEKKKQIREKFKMLFQYQSKPPRWIQGSDWLMKGDVPLFFVGQMELKHDSFHDNGAVYIFLDTESGKIETVQQFY